MPIHIGQAHASDVMLRVENLSVTYPTGVTALRSTNVGFRRGEITVLLGSSGAGKSTLLRTLNHLTVPTAGSVVSSAYGPLDRSDVLRKHRRRTAMVFQHHQLIERRTALVNVMTGRLGYHSTWRSLLPACRSDVELALQCLERVGMLDKALSRVDQLSGGQQQRVGIARALAQTPEMILADEPVASLDPATSEKVLGLLQTVCREDGIAAVISLHQLDYASRFADRIIGLANSQVVFDGPPAKLGEHELSLIYGGQRASAKKAPAATATPSPLMALTPSMEMS